MLRDFLLRKFWVSYTQYESSKFSLKRNLMTIAVWSWQYIVLLTVMYSTKWINIVDDEMSFFHRLIYVLWSLLLIRCQYYFAWTFGKLKNFRLLGFTCYLLLAMCSALTWLYAIQIQFSWSCLQCVRFWIQRIWYSNGRASLGFGIKYSYNEVWSECFTVQNKFAFVLLLHLSR